MTDIDKAITRNLVEGMRIKKRTGEGTGLTELFKRIETKYSTSYALYLWSRATIQFAAERNDNAS